MGKNVFVRGLKEKPWVQSNANLVTSRNPYADIPGNSGLSSCSCTARVSGRAPNCGSWPSTATDNLQHKFGCNDSDIEDHITMRLRTFNLLLFLAISPVLFCGCQILQSKIQESRMSAARPEATVDGTELRLESSLHRTFYPDGRRFDLSGQLAVVALNGSLPAGVTIYHMALRPGWPGYIVVNCKQRDGRWWMIYNGINQEYLTFSGMSEIESDRVTIEFTWGDLGGRLGEKPKRFATYDVSVSISDAKGNHYTLTTPQVPTD